MITEKINAVKGQIEGIQDFVSPGVWKMLQPVVNELADAASIAKAFEENIPVKEREIFIIEFTRDIRGMSGNGAFQKTLEDVFPNLAEMLDSLPPRSAPFKSSGVRRVRKADMHSPGLWSFHDKHGKGE